MISESLDTNTNTNIVTAPSGGVITLDLRTKIHSFYIEAFDTAIAEQTFNFFFRSAMDFSVRTVLRYATEAIPFTIGLTAKMIVLSLIFVLKTFAQGIVLMAQLLGHIFLLLWEGWEAPMFEKQRTRTYRPYPYASGTGTYDLRRGR